MSCINTNNPEYLSLLKRANTLEFLVRSLSSYYIDNFGRLPYLDEIPGANSTAEITALPKQIDKLLDSYGVDTIEQVERVMNDTYRDLFVDIYALDKDAIIDTTRRPSLYKADGNTDANTNTVTMQFDPSKIDDKLFRIMLFSMLNDLQKYNGISITPITSKDIDSEAPVLLKAFIQNGLIFINTDLATINTPLHEILHIVVGGMRFTDPIIYQLMLQAVAQLPNYNILSKLFNNRTLNDIMEEVLVEEMSKVLSNERSYLNQLPVNILHELKYNLFRSVDTLLLGTSVKSMSTKLILNSSIKQLGITTLSPKLINLNTAEISYIHRQLLNMKLSLLSNNELLEICI